MRKHHAIARAAAISLIFATASFAAGSAFAIGPGDYAVAGRDSSGRMRHSEVRILSKPGSKFYFAKSYCGQTFYVSNYSEKQANKWAAENLVVNVEHVSMSGRRQVVCRIR